MPKELKKRQRGGRSKKKNESDQQTQADVETKPQQNDTEFHEQDFVALGDTPKPSAGPSMTRSVVARTRIDNNEVDPAAPFGFVDPDIKAYFRSVDERLREWEGLGLVSSEDAESELEGLHSLECACQGSVLTPPLIICNADRTSFLHSSLSELRSLELKLSTDQDCALIMERLLHSMGDWGRRVVADSFAGQYVFSLEYPKVVH